jgi:hypothetical protein
MIDPEPWQVVIKSNLTVMLLVFFGLAGFCNSRMWTLIEKKYPRYAKKGLLGWRIGTWCSIPTLILVLMALIGIHVAAGYQLRW